jgi:hypothetical protein
VTATNQVQFAQRFVVNDDTSVLYGNARSYTAVNLPPGLSIIQTNASRGIVFGIPTQAGTYTATIIGWSSVTPGFGIEHFQSQHQAVFTVLPGSESPPVIKADPHSVAVHAGESFALTVEVQGTGLFRYQWLSNTIAVLAWTNSVLNFADPVPSMTGSYAVRVENSGGSATSQPASVLVAGPLRLIEPRLNPELGLAVRFVGLTNRSYTIETADLPGGEWSATGGPIQGAGGTNTVWIPLGGKTVQFSRIKTID